MGMHTYIGARYVPSFKGVFDPTTEYTALDVVNNGSGTSYIAKKPVPVGTPLTDSEYWFVYGSASGAIINLQDQIDAIQDQTIYRSAKYYAEPGLTDSQILQNAVDDTAALVLDRDYTIDQTLNINNPISINLNGFTINANLVDTNAIDIFTGDVEICNGEIYVTVSDPENASWYGACILTKNYLAYNNPPKMEHIKIHDLKLSTNAPVFLSLCAEVYNSEVYNIEFDGDRSNKSANASIGVNLEWHGTPHVNTWHPHDIVMYNLIGHHLTTGVRIASSFNITVDNCFFYNLSSGLQDVGSGVEVAIGDWGNEAAQPEYKAFVNKNIKVKNVCVYIAPNGIHALGNAYGNVECDIDGLIFTTDNYSLGRAVSLLNIDNWNIKNVEAFKCNNGMQINGCKNIKISGCELHDVQVYGMYILNSEGIEVKDNKIYDVNQAASSTTPSVTTAGIGFNACTKVIVNGNLTGGGASEHMAVDIYLSSDSSKGIVTDNLYDVLISTNANFVIDNNLQY